MERAEKGTRKGPAISRSFILLAAFCCHLTCASYKAIRPTLDPQSQKFLDIIRYIVTAQEERIFREMPPEDRAEFVADFWRRRDPDPETEANEFRDQYYSRLAAADKAFRTAIPGWMTDRGRVFILLGPPTDVIRKSMGEHTTELSKGARVLSSDLIEEGTRTERPTEVWVYNEHPDYFAGPLRLVFVDYDSTGDYKLTTDVEVKPFSMMTYLQSGPDMIKYQWIGQVESAESREKILPFLDFRKSLGEVGKNGEDYTVTGTLDIPFGAVSYRKEDESYAYDLELSMEVRHVELKSHYRDRKNLQARLPAAELERYIREGLSLTDTIVIPLEKGTNRIYFSVEDKVSQKRLRKLETIKIKG